MCKVKKDYHLVVLFYEYVSLSYLFIKFLICLPCAETISNK